VTDLVVDNAGLALHVELDGPAGAPPVLVLHGITASTATWDWLVPLIADTHQVARLDFRGHGASDRAPGEYHSAGYVSDAAAVCESLFDGPCTVIGHSLGGITALGLAQSRPELVARIVLEDPPMATARATLEGNSLLESFRLMRQSVPQVQASGVDVENLMAFLGMAPTASGSTFADELHPDAVRAMAVSLLQLDVTVLDPVLEGTAMAWVFDPDRPVQQPGVLVAADPTSPDCVCRPDQIERVRAAGTSFDVRVPTGAGHLIHDSRRHREQMAAAVRDVLAG
jgi:esterase